MNKIEKEEVWDILNKAVMEIGKVWGGEPLDGDETEDISKAFLDMLDTNNGNK
jgi:hypothetical protein